MGNIDPLLTKLDSIADLSASDRALLTKLPISQRRLGAREELLHQGDRPTQSVLLMDGVLVRYQGLPDGGRQTVSYHFPGEVPDLHSLFIERMDHSLASISESLLGLIPHSALHQVIRSSPTLSAILWRETLIDAAIFRQWIANNGRRRALAGTAHLLCEFMTRIKAIGGLEPDGSWLIPFTQNDLSEALGVSIVHLNRTLRALRQMGAVKIHKGRLKVGDWDALRRVAGFDPTYLHLRKRF